MHVLRTGDALRDPAGCLAPGAGAGLRPCRRAAPPAADTPRSALAELARRFPADRPLMLVAEDQGRIVGGALAFRTDPAPAAGGVTWTSSDSGASGGSPHASRDRPAAGRGDRHPDPGARPADPGGTRRRPRHPSPIRAGLRR